MEKLTQTEVMQAWRLVAKLRDAVISEECDDGQNSLEDSCDTVLAALDIVSETPAHENFKVR